MSILPERRTFSPEMIETAVAKLAEVNLQVVIAEEILNKPDGWIIQGARKIEKVEILTDEGQVIKGWEPVEEPTFGIHYHEGQYSVFIDNMDPRIEGDVRISPDYLITSLEEAILFICQNCLFFSSKVN